MATVDGSVQDVDIIEFASSYREISSHNRVGQFFSFGGEDSVPPEVAIISPTVGTSISRASKLKFDVTDDKGAFRRILPAVRFPDGRYELVHDGESFTPDYDTSTRVAISGGYEYEVERNGGWRDSPTLVLFAYDISGNENL